MSNTHAGHEIVKCSVCGSVIRQCRCFAPDKPVRHEICEKCMAVEPRPVTPPLLPGESRPRPCSKCGEEFGYCRCPVPDFKIVPFVPKDQLWANGAPDMIAEFAQRVASGELKPTKAIIIYVEDTPDGQQRPHYWTTRLSQEEIIAWCEVTKANCMDEWKK